MDMTESIRPKSDQLDADELLSGPRTFTITEVRKGPSEDQPFNFVLAEHPKPWRPCKTVRKLIVAAWGPETTAYHGRSLTLVRDPAVTWAGEAVGGIRVSHMSHLGKPLRVSVQATKKTKTAILVEPLADAAPEVDRRVKAVEAFMVIGVTPQQLASKFGDPDVWGNDDIANLLATYQSIQSGALTVADTFPTTQPADGA